jgi:hypothetical protein
MGVYKSFTTSDVIVTPFKVNKSFTFNGDEVSNSGIDRFIGKNISYVSGSDTTGQIATQSQALIYQSVEQLYYSNFISGSNGSPVTTASFNIDGTITSTNGAYQPMYENFLQSTYTASRFFPTGSEEYIGVISIPSNLFGEYIKPGTFNITNESGRFIYDDGEGNLLQNIGDTKVGDIIYGQGMTIITGYYNNLSALQDYIGGIITISFQSTLTIFESQYKCTSNPNEFTYTQNPSAISGSTNQSGSNSGIVYDFLTGSYFQPYVTTIGLYNNANQLVAVGKLSQPLQNSNVTDTTILVNLDL